MSQELKELKKLNMRFMLCVALTLFCCPVLRPQGTSGNPAQHRGSSNGQPQSQKTQRVDNRYLFKVDHVDQNTVFINGGKNAGLAEGMTLTIKGEGRFFTASGAEYKAAVVVAVIEVTSVANTTAMCTVRAKNQEIRPGDIAWLSPAELKSGSTRPPSKPGPTASGNLPSANAPSSSPSAIRNTFKIKYVAEDVVYIEGGKDAGLVVGMTLAVQHPGDSAATPAGLPNVKGNSIAEITVVSVSSTSAVCEIRNKTTDIQRGDVAILSQADQNKQSQANTVGPTRKYPQVIAFSEGDPLDEEQRATVPTPPLPEVNRARGRIGFDYSYISGSGTSPIQTSQIGGVIRIDMSRIAGTYWNLDGYWRGRMNTLTSSSQPQSVNDLINRTYTLGFTYANPTSSWTAGVGRLYLPWATSLDTLDGGYFGYRFRQHTIIGAFAGTSPDPTSFDYNPDRRTAGTFVAFEWGSFEKFRFTSTEGVAVSAIDWKEDRQFLFNETGLFYKRFFSVFNAMQADKQHTNTGGIEEGFSRSFTTVRVQPLPYLSFDVNHNYFRDVPTFNASLVSTGLLDKFLFQGFSAGARLELPKQIGLYGDFGQSSRTGDTRTAFNQLYGITLGKIWLTGIRADVRYAKFNSSFGSGDYRAATLARSFKELLHVEVNLGRQTFVSSLGAPTDYRLLGSTVDYNLGAHYFMESTVNLQRGQQQSFTQYIGTVGYRFDNKRGWR
jgi:hypothetical protein